MSTTEMMAYGVEPAARPAFSSVARYMFKVYDDEGGVYCTACNRVMAGEHAKLARHYRLCERRREPAAAADESAAAVAYACGTCAETMDDRAQWTLHFGTRDHWRRYDEAMSRSLHFQPSHECACEHCGHTFYDTAEYIKRHMYVEHDSGYRVHSGTRFMAAVYRARSSYFTGAMHCCTGCDEIRVNKPVHDPLSPVCGEQQQQLETFFCDSCRLTFVGREPEYARHSSSPEHVALAQNLGGTGARAGADDDRWTLPRIVWCHFGGYPRAGGVITCDLCGDRVPGADEHAVLRHLERCAALPTAAAEQLLPTPPSGKSAADYDAFRCGVCSTTSRTANDDDDEPGRPMADFGAWSRHMTAGPHLMTPRASCAYTYSECSACRTLYFGPQQRADDGSRCAGTSRHRFQPFPVSDVMRFVYAEMNAAADGVDDDGDDGSTTTTGGVHALPHFYYEQATGKFGRCDRSAEPDAVPFYCTTCRLEFYGNRAAFRQHALTAEHMLLRQYAPFDLSAAAAGDFSAFRTTAASCSAYTSAGTARPAFERAMSYGWQVGNTLDAIGDTKMKATVKTAIGSIINMFQLQQHQRQQTMLRSGRESMAINYCESVQVSDRESVDSDDKASTVVLRHEHIKRGL